jgi:hypothetical protein
MLESLSEWRDSAELTKETEDQRDVVAFGGLTVTPRTG